MTMISNKDSQRPDCIQGHGPEDYFACSTPSGPVHTDTGITGITGIIGITSEYRKIQSVILSPKFEKALGLGLGF